MTIKFITNPEYTVYETAANVKDGPFMCLKMLTHPVAHYDNDVDMYKDWINEFLDGTHNFIVSQKE